MQMSTHFHQRIFLLTNMLNYDSIESIEEYPINPLFAKEG